MHNTTGASETATSLAASLHKLAEFVEANPELAPDLQMSLDGINVPHIDARGNAREYLAKYATAGARSGAEVIKNFTGTYSSVEISFGAVALHIYADRAEVCERVVVGTRQVTKEVKDPEALAAVPTVTVTETVEDVEWRCHPILDQAGGAR